MKNIKLLCLCGVLCCAMWMVGCNKNDDAPQTDNQNNAVEDQDTAELDETQQYAISVERIEGYDETEEVEFEPEEETEATYALFEDFLGIGSDSDVKATVDEHVQVGYDDWDMNYGGKSFSLSELRQLIKDTANCELSKLPSVSYIYFPSIGLNDLLAVKFTGVGIEGYDDDNSYTVMIFANRDGKLYLTYSYSGWSRCDSELSDIGLYYSSGSSGAGEYSVEYGCFQEDGRYQQLYSVDSLFDVWIGMDIDQEIFDQVYNSDGDDTATYMIAEVMTIDDDTYYSYDFQDGHSATEQDEEFIELTSKSGIKWQTRKEMEQITAERLESFGLDAEFMEIEDGSWEEL